MEKTRYVHAFLDFLENFSDVKNIARIFFDKKNRTERYSLNQKRVLFFADDMDYNNLQMYHMYQDVCDIRLCFDKFIKAAYEEIEKLLEGVDVFFIGALSNHFINTNRTYLTNLLSILTALQIEVITVFPIVNTYERMILTQNSHGTVKSIYK